MFGCLVLPYEGSRPAQLQCCNNNYYSIITHFRAARRLARLWQAWQNFHALAEVAKARVGGVTNRHSAASAGTGQALPRVRGGTGLVAELLAQQGAWASPFVHVGYGLRRYELAAACFDPRKPSLRGTEKPKPLADSTVLRAFNMFDKVRCPVRTGCDPPPARERLPHTAIVS